jgi:hypothetical protein
MGTRRRRRRMLLRCVSAGGSLSSHEAGQMASPSCRVAAPTAKGRLHMTHLNNSGDGDAIPCRKMHLSLSV